VVSGGEQRRPPNHVMETWSVVALSGCVKDHEIKDRNPQTLQQFLFLPDESQVSAKRSPQSLVKWMMVFSVQAIRVQG